jgi:hypothetical protein
LAFTAIANALADWKVKKEASLHVGGDNLEQAQEEEEENIYAVPPELDVRRQCIGNLYLIPCHVACSSAKNVQHFLSVS